VRPGYWRTRLDEPLLDPGLRRVVRAAVRSCEAIVAAGWDGRLVRRVVHDNAA
jgi:hypothetical protein